MDSGKYTHSQFIIHVQSSMETSPEMGAGAAGGSAALAAAALASLTQIEMPRITNNIKKQESRKTYNIN